MILKNNILLENLLLLIIMKCCIFLELHSKLVHIIRHKKHYPDILHLKIILRELLL